MYLKNIEQHLGMLVRTYRKQAGFTQSELARKLGLSHQQIQKYETGANRISVSRLYEISHILSFDPIHLLQLLEESGAKRNSTPKQNMSSVQELAALAKHLTPKDRALMIQLIHRLSPAA